MKKTDTSTGSGEFTAPTDRLPPLVASCASLEMGSESTREPRMIILKPTRLSTGKIVDNCGCEQSGADGITNSITA